MFRDIPLDIPKPLVGVPPSPGPSALRTVEHALRRGFFAPFGRSLPHIRAGVWCAAVHIKQGPLEQQMGLYFTLITSETFPSSLIES